MNFHRVQDGNIAYDQVVGNKFDLVFLSGLKSDRMGTKAMLIEDFAITNGLGSIRFDYLGHGDSEGEFTDFGINDWLENTLNVIDNIARNPVILIGSSLGGWLALLASLKRPKRVVGLVTLAAAPDFTEDLMWDLFDEKTQDVINNDGVYNLPADDCDGEYPITKKLIESGRENLLLRNDNILNINIPTYCIHGQKDKDVPYETSTKIFGRLKTESKKLILRTNSDHRLSSEPDLRVLWSVLDDFIKNKVKS